MTARIAAVCAALSPCRVFADIGCDHGYMTQYMLERGLCERAYISDISAGSLEKAKKLLLRYVAAGKCIPVVASGLEGIEERCDEVLIAGMGGMEIVEILEKHPLPERFVLQPMKNPERVRAFLLARGCHIDLDYTIGEGKYYELIAGTNTGGDTYSEQEILYGRDNLRRPTLSFVHKIEDEQRKLRGYLERTGIQRKNREEMLSRLKQLEEIEYAVKGRLSNC